MSLKLCTAEYFLSGVDGTGPRRTWFPRRVAEQFLESVRDGEITLSPDPVTMIDGDVSWFNNTPDPQYVAVQVHRAPRSVVAQNPATVVIHDAWTHRIGSEPIADYPSVIADTFGGRLQVDRASVAREDVRYGRYFLDGDTSQRWVPVGVVPAGQSFHFRYLAAVQTPGAWVIPTEFPVRWEAHARWTRLVAMAAPAVGQ